MAAIEFDNPFAKFVENNTKLSKPELIRALRYMVSAEYEATSLYQQLSEVIPDEYANLKDVIEDIAREELKHVGEFLELLANVTEEEFDLYDEGMDEASKILDYGGYDPEDNVDDSDKDNTLDNF